MRTLHPKLLRRHFDRAVKAGEWEPDSCVLAQFVKENFTTHAIADVIFEITMTDPDASKAMSVFDSTFEIQPWIRDTPAKRKKRDAALAQLRLTLPIRLQIPDEIRQEYGYQPKGGAK